MTTRNSTAAQLRGEQLKRYAVKATWIMNFVSFALIAIFVFIGKS